MGAKKLTREQKKAIWSGPRPKEEWQVRNIHRPYKGLVEEQDLLAPTYLERWEQERGDHVVRDLTGKRVR